MFNVCKSAELMSRRTPKATPCLASAGLGSTSFDQPGLATANRWLVSLASTSTSARLDMTARRTSSIPGKRMILPCFTTAEIALS
ncbi:hypothetical protein D3C84_1028010 [compost metagenome]